ncbi:uncharacterized protein [Mytilus edulis]|uniref:uncharacterized protein n=1 Tax=Mytilus edulis TaxID=6550 RepID=UPI0039F01ACA
MATTHQFALSIIITVICVEPVFSCSYSWNETYKLVANCENQGLTSVPRNLSRDIQELIFSQNLIDILKNNSFINYTNMDIYIYEIHEDAFAGLNSLKVLKTVTVSCLQTICMFDAERQYEVLPHIDDFDCRMAAESIIEKLISKYQFSSPQEYQNANGFKVKLPDIQYVNYKSDMQITKEQPSELTNEQHNNNNISCQDNQFNVLSNNYVKTKDLSEKTNKCFVKIKEGMIVKLKVTTDESEVAFGWYKTNPWTQKKCGFFRKSTENIELT